MLAKMENSEHVRKFCHQFPRNSHTHICAEPSNTPKKLMATALVHKNCTEVNEASIDRNKIQSRK